MSPRRPRRHRRRRPPTPTQREDRRQQPSAEAAYPLMTPQHSLPSSRVSVVRAEPGSEVGDAGASPEVAERRFSLSPQGVLAAPPGTGKRGGAEIPRSRDAN